MILDDEGRMLRELSLLTVSSSTICLITLKLAEQ